MASIPSSKQKLIGLQNASAAITVIRIGEGVRPTYAGTNEVGGEDLHHVSVRSGLVLQGTMDDLRNFVGDLGLAIADVELADLHEKVREGRRLAAERERRMA